MGMQICINGQLLILKLIEMLSKKGIHCICANTDGASFKIKKSEYEILKEVCAEWEVMTKLELEYAEYKSLIFRDINSYLWLPYKEGKEIKLKGVFELKKDWHKNQSMSIVYKSLYEYYINGVPVEETIRSCDNIFEFCKSVKSKGGGRYVTRFYKKGVRHEVAQQKTIRYYVSPNGQQFIKIMPPIKKDTQIERHRKSNPLQSNIFDLIDDETIEIKDRESEVEAGHKCVMYNVHIKKDNISAYDIDYNYYINEARKIIKQIAATNDNNKGKIQRTVPTLFS
jgi:hypothetical protein